MGDLRDHWSASKIVAEQHWEEAGGSGSFPVKFNQGLGGLLDKFEEAQGYGPAKAIADKISQVISSYAGKIQAAQLPHAQFTWDKRTFTVAGYLTFELKKIQNEVSAQLKKIKPPPPPPLYEKSMFPDAEQCVTWAQDTLSESDVVNIEECIRLGRQDNVLPLKDGNLIQVDWWTPDVGKPRFKYFYILNEQDKQVWGHA